MSITRIQVHTLCDECGTVFYVEIDPATRGGFWAFAYDLAEDAIRGSLDYREVLTGNTGSSSVQDDKHLCHRCTRVADRKAERDDAAQVAREKEENLHAQ